MIYEPPPDDKSAFALNKRNISGILSIPSLSKTMGNSTHVNIG